MLLFGSIRIDTADSAIISPFVNYGGTAILAPVSNTAFWCLPVSRSEAQRLRRVIVRRREWNLSSRR